MGTTKRNRSSQGQLNDDYLYGEHVRDVRRRNKFAEHAARKSLNMPLDDDMYIDASRKGIGIGGLIAGILAGSVVPSLVAGYLWWQSQLPKTNPPMQDTNTEYTIEPMPGE